MLTDDTTTTLGDLSLGEGEPLAYEYDCLNLKPGDDFDPDRFDPDEANRRLWAASLGAYAG